MDLLGIFICCLIFCNGVVDHVLWTNVVSEIKYFVNKIAIRATAPMAADKEAIGLSRFHMYKSKCILPLLDNCLLN